MTQDEAATHWQKRARAELKTARVIFEQEDPELYGEAIFHCHLAVELALKARHLEELNKPAPFIHNLGELAHALRGEWTEDELDDFDELSDSALLARYGDREWYEQSATKENAGRWIEKVERMLSKIQL